MDLIHQIVESFNLFLIKGQMPNLHFLFHAAIRLRDEIPFQRVPLLDIGHMPIAQCRIRWEPRE